MDSRSYANKPLSRVIAALSPGGFNAHPVESLNDQLTFPICQFVAREPTLTKCGHQFCQECLKPSLGMVM